jgi:hypothetical protein
MFINENIVAIVFKLINFIALIGAFCFVFTKYLRATLVSLIHEKEASHEALCAQQLHLESKQHSLDVIIKAEAAQCQDFKYKIDTWNKAIAIETEKQRQESQKLVVTIQERQAEIALKKENQRIQNDLTVLMATQVKTSLDDYFKNPQCSEKYIDTIIQFMNKRAS